MHGRHRNAVGHAEALRELERAGHVAVLEAGQRERWPQQRTDRMPKWLAAWQLSGRRSIQTCGRRRRGVGRDRSCRSLRTGRPRIGVVGWRVRKLE